MKANSSVEIYPLKHWIVIVYVPLLTDTECSNENSLKLFVLKKCQIYVVLIFSFDVHMWVKS